MDSTDVLAGDEIAMERVVPTGSMHVVFRLSSAPLTVYDDASGNGARTLARRCD